MIPISIIIPAYNEEKSIARAIKSATAQSLKNIEIIVVNDASPDKTAEIVKQIASTDNRVKLISHNKNMGLNQSRLTGLSIAQGEYIQFLDADDSLEKNAIEQLYSHAKSHNLDMVMMGSQHYHKYLKFKSLYFILINISKRQFTIRLSLCQIFYVNSDFLYLYGISFIERSY